MLSLADLMEGTNGSLESQKCLSKTTLYKQKEFLLIIFRCDSLPKLTQGQLKRLSQDSVNRYLKIMQKLSNHDRR